jgi:two-component system, chemotaxis family, CheB/CheR fusion protein
LINVTDFFRDEQGWEYISNAITPQIVTNKPSSAPLRVWSAGCASGQEAYTIAMVLAEKIGIENFRERVKIYASDADEEALSQARQASYSTKEVSNIPPALLAKYFEKSERRYIFNKELRRSIIFGRHDLIQDAPISRVDLIMCRNTLMYFNIETQSKVLARFHFALNDPGFLFLGKAEMLFTHAHLFTPVDIKRRVFTKVPRINMRDKLLNLSSTINIKENNSHLMRFVRFRDTAFDTNPIAQIVSDLNGFLVLANERARCSI